ncbi:TonB-dependent receptor [Caulobacter radicis]|uniref:TonB-dependent receptor n=1 Tax=Caulobacter radicis TaxID=2172650 RepID=A0A2T9JXS0_9CAUL|nr:TonB-dependent receptor [Caulobacter radicis]PVM88522.1 TonB-dependent receptor [Caulobacter radicis]
MSSSSSSYGSRLRTGCSLAVLMSAALAAGAASAQTAPQPSGETTENAVEEVIVTGFRESLKSALNVKRQSSGVVDAIKAEDIADFPDANLAESIQRVPGVSITRVAGEGRTITVRGLPPNFTRVRINGMEAQATSGATTSDRGANLGRGFDFNTFASELFSGIAVRKTAQAEVIEGSLGATVDLDIAKPLDQKGRTFVVGGSLGYNDLSKKNDKKLSAVLGDRWDTAWGQFGAQASLAWSKREFLEDQWGSGGWNPATVDGGFCTPVGRPVPNPAFNAANGTDAANCATGVPRPAANDTLFDLGNRSTVFFPRLPRYGRFHHDQERTGATLALQWKPSERTSFGFDALYSNYDVVREENWLEGFSFARAISQNGKPQTAIRELILREAGTSHTAGANFGLPVYDVAYARFDGVDVRSDTQHDEFQNVFQQYTFNGKHELTDNITISGLVGYSKSDYDQPITTTIMFQRPNTSMTIDFRDDRDQPKITHGFNVADASQYSFAAPNAEVRLSQIFTTNIYKTAEFNLAWAVDDDLTIKVGAHHHEFTFDTSARQRSNNFLVPTLTTAQLQAVTKVVDDFGGNGIKKDVFPSSWATIDYDKFVSSQNLYSDSGMYALIPNYGGIRRVEEKVTSAYLQADLRTEIGGLPVRGDVGFRIAQTDLASRGYQIGATPQQVTAEHSYHDVLPSLNFAVDLRDDLVVRFSAAKVVSRPDLGFLTPGGSLNLTGTPSIASGNPELDPIRATTVDLGAEWYFAPGSVLGVGVFYKDIATYVQNQSQQMTFRETGLPLSLIGTSGVDPDNTPITVTRPVNTPGGPLKGFEINYQQTFTFLPSFLRHTGALVNYTYVDSQIDYFLAAGGVTTNDLVGLSKNAYNATLYYEDAKFSARVSASYRDKSIVALPANNPLQDVEGYDANLTFDMAASYQINDRLKLSLEGLNIFDRFNRQFIDSDRDSTFVYTHTGRQFNLGLQYRF